MGAAIPCPEVSDVGRQVAAVVVVLVVGFQLAVVLVGVPLTLVAAAQEQEDNA